MFYLILAAIVLCIGSMVHFQWSTKRYERRMYGSRGGPGASNEEVVMLDEEEGGATGKAYEQPPTKMPMLAAFGVTVLLVFYWIFLYEGPETTASTARTYDELGIKTMLTTLADQAQFPAGGNKTAVIILPPYMYDQYSAFSQATGGDEKTKPKEPAFMVIVNETLKRGSKFATIEYKPSVSLLSAAYRTGDGVELRPAHLQDAVLTGAKPDAVISLAGYQPDLAAKAAAGAMAAELRDRKYFFAVFVDQALLYAYLDMVESGEVNLAVVSKCTYRKDVTVPEGAAEDELFQRHFLAISKANCQHLRTQYQQLIGPNPFDPKAFSKP